MRTAIDVLQTDADREAQEVLEVLAESGFPAPWDAAPVEEMNLDVTAELRAVPETPGRDGEHPRWTAAMRKAVQEIDARTADWRATEESHRQRVRLDDDEWTDEPTRAD